MLAEAEAAARRTPSDHDRFDARAWAFATLDPASSTDLDQAYFLERSGDDIIIQYAIADVAFFVDRGSKLEAEAWKRGSTVYAPDGRVPQYPEVLSEGAASLLPDQDRAAIIMTVSVAPDGTPVLLQTRRAIIRSRAKLGYENVTPAEIGEILPDLAARIAAAEDRRGSPRIEFPEQEVETDPSSPGGLRLVARDRLPSEDQNAALSLAANLAVAQRLLGANVGLFRVMAEPADRAIGALHHVANALGVAWPRDTTARELAPRLNATNPKHAALLRSLRRAGGGASYAIFDPEQAPWHSAIAAPYAHATAPLRRLADRYVLDLLVDLEAGVVADQSTLDLLAALPDAMERAESRANNVERAAIDLVEAVLLAGRVGQVFEAVVTDTDRDSATIQLAEPAVRARTAAPGVSPGDTIKVRLVTAHPSARQVTFELVHR